MTKDTFPCFTFCHANEDFLSGLYSIYGIELVTQEMSKMDMWLQANPRRQKKNLKRFIVNWLNRAAESVTAKDRARHLEVIVGQGPVLSEEARQRLQERLRERSAGAAK